jgi:hypothetical protein
VAARIVTHSSHCESSMRLPSQCERREATETRPVHETPRTGWGAAPGDHRQWPARAPALAPTQAGHTRCRSPGSRPRSSCARGAFPEANTVWPDCEFEQKSYQQGVGQTREVRKERPRLSPLHGGRGQGRPVSRWLQSERWRPALQPTEEPAGLHAGDRQRARAMTHENIIFLIRVASHVRRGRSSIGECSGCVRKPVIATIV